jgi:O-antigen/teichoic acid export membrane protein
VSTTGSQRIARNALARLIGEVIGKAASLVFFVTMARELGREGFGAFMFALGLTGALVLCAGFGTDELTAREVARDRSRAGRFLADVISLKVVTCTALMAGALVVVSVGTSPPTPCRRSRWWERWSPARCSCSGSDVWSAVVLSEGREAATTPRIDSGARRLVPLR